MKTVVVLMTIVILMVFALPTEAKEVQLGFNLDTSATLNLRGDCDVDGQHSQFMLTGNIIFPRIKARLTVGHGRDRISEIIMIDLPSVAFFKYLTAGRYNRAAVITLELSDEANTPLTGIMPLGKCSEINE